ncbi:hypothetical protein VNO78_33027 [Psophocarpus tetragonolobus]|uniref:Uncharacterized protein n=1 Tax=Psophocarpus tetragonolobus TaxID=3891 RepID=A0AAN9P1M5_PSOTE
MLLTPVSNLCSGKEEQQQAPAAVKIPTPAERETVTECAAVERVWESRLVLSTPMMLNGKKFTTPLAPSLVSSVLFLSPLSLSLSLSLTRGKFSFSICF